MIKSGDKIRIVKLIDIRQVYEVGDILTVRTIFGCVSSEEGLVFETKEHPKVRYLFEEEIELVKDRKERP